MEHSGSLPPPAHARGAVVVIALPARVASANVRVLRSRSERALVAGHRAVAVDLRAVDNLDTQTLSELCCALRRIARHGAKVAIVGADVRVRSAIELCDIAGIELHLTLRSVVYTFERPKSATRRSVVSPPGRRAAIGRSFSRGLGRSGTSIA
jgi:anti-anti-sigma regulatory factor